MSNANMEQTAFLITGIPESMEINVCFPAPEGAQIVQMPPKRVVIQKAPVDTTTFEYKAKLFAMPLEMRNTILDSVGISRDNLFWYDILADYCARHGKDFLN